MSSEIRAMDGAGVLGATLAAERPFGPEPGRPRFANRANLERLLSVASPVLLLLAWEGGARVGLIDTRFFAPPSTIFSVLWQMALTGELWVHLTISLERIAIGFLIGAVPAVIIGLAMGLMPIVRALLQPLVDATFPIPKIAI